MGSYAPGGCDWITLDATTDGTEAYHPTGAGALRTAILVSAATYTAATRRITKTGAFTAYTFTAGDVFRVTAGTGLVIGEYEISSKVSNNIIDLKPNGLLPFANNTDTDGYIIPVDSPIARAAACVVYGALITVSEVGARTIDIKDFTGATTLTGGAIPVDASLATPHYIQIGGPNGQHIPGGFSVACGTGSATLAFNLYYARAQ
jgi:hypothetical protein